MIFMIEILLFRMKRPTKFEKHLFFFSFFVLLDNELDEFEIFFFPNQILKKINILSIQVLGFLEK